MAPERGDRHARPRNQTSRTARIMLRIARALGFLAPIAVAAFISIMLATSPTASGSARAIQLLLAALALVAGMTSMALATWSYFGWRLNRIARALEETLEADAPVEL